MSEYIMPEKRCGLCEMFKDREGLDYCNPCGPEDTKLCDAFLWTSFYSDWECALETFGEDAVLITIEGDNNEHYHLWKPEEIIAYRETHSDDKQYPHMIPMPGPVWAKMEKYASEHYAGAPEIKEFVNYVIKLVETY